MIDWTQFNAVDWVIVTAIGLSIVLSLWRGFTREAISLAGWVAAFLVAGLFGDALATLLAQWIDNPTGRYVAACGLLFAGTLILAALLNSLVAQLLRATGLTVTDRLLGTAFGFARGVLVVLLAVYVLRQLVPPQNLQWLQDSQLMPHLDVLAQWARQFFDGFNHGP